MVVGVAGGVGGSSLFGLRSSGFLVLPFRVWLFFGRNASGVTIGTSISVSDRENNNLPYIASL